MEPPSQQLDNAEVLWAVSSRGAFYVQPSSRPPITVVAMAVACYTEGGPYYLFKCDLDWQVVADWVFDSVEEAKGLADEHAFGEVLEWQTHA